MQKYEKNTDFFLFGKYIFMNCNLLNIKVLIKKNPDRIRPVRIAILIFLKQTINQIEKKLIFYIDLKLKVTFLNYCKLLILHQHSF